LCILRVSTDVLDLPKVVVTDGNAASTSRGYAKFAAAPDGLSIVDRDLTFAKYWTDPDLFTRYRKTCAKCAEVLVPGAVPLKYITGAYVSCQESLDTWQSIGTQIEATLNGDLFFR
jgi:hypothetical protein